MAEIGGGNLKVRINSQIFKAQTASIRDTVGEGDVTSSESEQDADSITCTDVIPTVATTRITLKNASYDPAENDFIAPRNLRRGMVVAVQIFPDGLDSEPWSYAACLVLEVSHDIDINNLQPVTITMRAKGAGTQPGMGG
jgi:hypothetical protein